MVRSSSVSVLAEVAAEMRFPGRGDRNGALGAVALAGDAMAIHTMFTIERLAARQAVSGLGEQGGGAATDRHDDE